MDAPSQEITLPGLGPGNVVLVTGVTGAVGRVVAQALLQMGCSVGGMARSERRLGDARQELAVDPTRLLTVAGDVARDDDARQAVKAVLDRWGRIDALIHLAAVNDGGPTLSEISVDLIDRVFEVNVRGSMLIAQAAAEPMVAQGMGRIVNVASVAARLASPQGTVYGATKAALVRFTRQLAVELGPYGIIANTVSPGYTPTTLLRFDDPPGTEGSPSRGNVERIPLGRWGELLDYVYPILFFASDMARYTTGTDLVVDGGASVAR